MRKAGFLICIFITNIFLFSQINQLQVNSLESMLQIAQGKEKLDILEQLIDEYAQTNPDQSITYAEQGVQISRELKIKKDEIYFTYVIGDLYFNQKQFGDAVEFYQRSYYLSKEHEDSFQQSIITERIGIVFQEISSYDKALEYYLLTLKLREKKSDDESYAGILMNIGNLYYDLEKYEIAYEYYQETYEIFINTGNQIDIAGIFVNLANVYQEMEQSAKALKHYRYALLIFRELNDQKGVARTLNNLGTVFFDQENNVEALVYFQSSEETIQKIDDTYLETLISLNLGATYINLNILDEAQKQLEKSLKLSKLHHFLDIRLSVYCELSRLYSKLNSSMKTYEFADKYITLKDSIFSEDSDKRIADLRIQYELDKKEEEIVDLYKAKETQLKLRNYFITISVLILLLLIVLFSLFRNKVKINRMLAESRKKFQDMFEKHNAVMLLVDPENGDIVSCNKAAKDFYGFINKNDVISNMFSISTHSKTQVENSIKDTLIEKQNRTIAQHRLSGGRTRDVELFSTPIEFGNKVLIYTIVQDITEQLHYESELKLLNINLENRIDQQVEKVQKQQALLMQKSQLESLGKLAAGIAHEINQPLGGISMGLDNIVFRQSMNKLSKSYLKEQFDFLFKQIDRIKHIIQHIRSFSRDQESVIVEKVDVNEVIRNSLLVIQTQYKDHMIELVTMLEEDTGFILGNKYRLEQVILNLLSNAKDAVEEKADLLTNPDYKKEIYIKTFAKRNVVSVFIRDNGIGIPKDILPNIFDPFFTTKETEKGTGLGLSIIYGIIQEMKGRIFAESKKNEFTEFRIEFPKI